MKKGLLIGLLCICTTTYAQNKNELIDASYNRSSVSIVTIEHGDKFDELAHEAALGISERMQKFDYNKIQTESIKLSTPRNTDITSSQINEIVSTAKIGNEVINFWYDNDNDGLMSDDLIWERGRYNATDDDVNIAEASKIGEYKLFDGGYKLLDNSYIVILDYSDINLKSWSEENKLSKKYEEHRQWSLKARACLYKVSFGPESQDVFYDKYWIDDTTSEQEANVRRAAFENYKVSLIELGDVSFEHLSSEYTLPDSSYDADKVVKSLMVRGYSSTMDYFRDNIESWNVKSAVKSVNPIKAQIGAKEGLNRGQRYKAYETRSKDGEIYSKKVGFVRVTDVANNIGNATGDSEMSEFYQISSIKNVKSGMVLKQSLDARMSVSAMYNIGALSDFNLSLDYMLSMRRGGNASYFILDMGYDGIGSSVKKAIPELDDTSFLNVGIGYGYGVRLTRFVEIVPQVLAIGDFVDWGDLDSDDEESTSMSKIGWYAKGGAKAKINIAYPFQLVVGVGYSFLIYSGDEYDSYNYMINNSDDSDLKKREGGFSLSAGINILF